MSVECVVCDEEASVSDACPHCGEVCCRDHRRPAAHDCSGTKTATSDGWRLDLDGTEVSAPTDPPLSRLLRPGAGVAILTLLLVVAALGAVAYAGGLDGGLEASAVESHVFEQTNDKRQRVGVDATVNDADLAAVARAHSRDMRNRKFINHTNPDGEDPQDRIEAAGLDCRVGENIYQTPRGSLADSERAFADHVVRSWLASPGHRETLLRERFDRQGVGVAVGAEAVYVTQVFC